MGGSSGDDGTTNAARAPEWVRDAVHQSSAFVAFRDDGTIVYANPIADELLQVDTGRLIGRQALDFIHPEDLNRAAVNISAVGGGARPRPGLMRLVADDGEVIPVDITPTMVRLAPPPDGPGDLTVVTLHDTATHDAYWMFLTALSAGEPFERCVRHFTEGFNVEEEGAIAFAYDEGGRRRSVGPLPAELVGVTEDASIDGRAGSPWVEALTLDAPIVRALAELPDWLAAAAQRVDMASLVVVPVPDPGESNPAFIVNWLPDQTMADSQMEALVRRPKLAVTLALQARSTSKRLEHLALHDALTGLGNRVQFFDLLGQLCGRGTPFGVVYLDLDGFKPVNDSLGHAAGDQALCIAAARLRETARTDDLVVRLGGDEFAVACPEVDDEAVLLGIAERLVATIRSPMRLDAEVVELGASAGAALSNPGDGPDDVVAAADAALYDAKQAGRGRARLAPRQEPGVVRAVDRSE